MGIRRTRLEATISPCCHLWGRNLHHQHHRQFFHAGIHAYVPGDIQTGGQRAAVVREVYHWGLDDLGKQFGALTVDAALMTGLLNEREGQDTVDVVTACFSSNCTYPLFTSLSVCSNIVEITSSITTRNVTDAQNYPWTLLSDPRAAYLGTSPGSNNGDKAADVIRNVSGGIEITLPNGFAISLPGMNIAFLTPMNGSVAFKPDDNRYRVGLVDMIAFFYNGDAANYHDRRDGSLRAFEVLFYMCVNTYNVTVINNEASSNIVSSYFTPAASGVGANRPLSCGLSNTTCNQAQNITGGTSHTAFHTGGREYSVDVDSAEYLGTSIARYLSGWRAATYGGDTVIHGYSAYRLMDDFPTTPASAPQPGLSRLANRVRASLNQV